MGLKENFEKAGFSFFEFDNREDAVSYLCDACAGRSVAFGGSVTAKELNLYGRLSERSSCAWHWEKDDPSAIAAARVYITSANAISQTGEIVNIDGNCNRVSSSMYGHEEVFFVVGENKVCPDLPSAWNRARNVAAPMNARRLNRATPCGADGVCHDCQSPECICSVISVMRKKPSSCRATVVLIHEALGY